MPYLAPERGLPLLVLAAYLLGLKPTPTALPVSDGSLLYPANNRSSLSVNTPSRIATQVSHSGLSFFHALAMLLQFSLLPRKINRPRVVPARAFDKDRQAVEYS